LDPAIRAAGSGVGERGGQFSATDLNTAHLVLLL
jgi:hypothetical protein